MGDKNIFDVAVVGSGASGGWACKRFSEAGLNVALIDAGRPQSDANFSEHRPAFELKYRNLTKEPLLQTRPIQSAMGNEFNMHWFANDLEEPYTTAPGMPFAWLGRVRHGRWTDQRLGTPVIPPERSRFQGSVA